jgi:hypothetical protein
MPSGLTRSVICENGLPETNRVTIYCTLSAPARAPAHRCVSHAEPTTLSLRPSPPCTPKPNPYFVNTGTLCCEYIWPLSISLRDFSHEVAWPRRHLRRGGSSCVGARDVSRPLTATGHAPRVAGQCVGPEMSYAGHQHHRVVAEQALAAVGPLEAHRVVDAAVGEELLACRGDGWVRGCSV